MAQVDDARRRTSNPVPAPVQPRAAPTAMDRELIELEQERRAWLLQEFGSSASRDRSGWYGQPRRSTQFATRDANSQGSTESGRVPPRGGIGAGGPGLWGGEPVMRRSNGSTNEDQFLRSWTGTPGFRPNSNGGHWMRNIHPGMFDFPFDWAATANSMPARPWRNPATTMEDAWRGVNFVGHREVRPRSGFTFDFDKDANEDKSSGGPSEIIRLDLDDDFPFTQEMRRKGSVAASSEAVSGRSKKALKPALACARCRNPLKNSDGMVNQDERVFALKCGHVIDAGCYEQLTKPPENRGLPILRPDEIIGDHSDVTSLQAAEDSSTSTRTRSAAKRKVSFAPGSVDMSSALSTPRLTGNKRPRVTHGKDKGEKYQWDCPLGIRCGREYTSVKMGGVWTVVPDDAAIQLYV